MAKRLYENDYASVTEALGVLRKIGLEMWFKFNTAQFCDEKSKKGREIGTDVHALIEKNINKDELKIDTVYPEEVTNAVKSFFLFKKEHPEISFNLSETPGTCEVHQYNFTIDCVASVAGEEVIGDWKTGECKKEEKPKIYDEHLYQVSGYVKGHNSSKGENIKRSFVVCFAKDKVAYNLQWLEEDEIDEYFHEVFLPALKIAKHQRRKKAEVKRLKKEGNQGSLL